MAAALGDADAQAQAGSWPELPQHYRSKIEMAADLLAHREAVAFALDCAVRALPAWELVFPADERPCQATEAVALWLSGRATAELLDRASRAAADAGIEADDPDRVPADEVLTAAIHAADAASHAALAAECAARPEDAKDRVSEVNSCVAWAANFALKTVPDLETERRWQLQRLANYLLGRGAPPS
jgi:hypothetical protein